MINSAALGNPQRVGLRPHGQVVAPGKLMRRPDESWHEIPPECADGGDAGAADPAAADPALARDFAAESAFLRSSSYFAMSGAASLSKACC